MLLQLYYDLYAKDVASNWAARRRLLPGPATAYYENEVQHNETPARRQKKEIW